MNEALPPPAPSAAPSRHAMVVVWIICALVMVLTALATGGYLLREELRAMANATPVAPPEVTEALTALNDKLERQRREDAQQLALLKEELAALKEQQAAQQPADMLASMAPLQAKLDAIAAQLSSPPAAAQAAAIEAPVAPEEAPTVTQPAAAENTPQTPVATAPEAVTTPDLAALARTIKSGEPYAQELSALAPQWGQHLARAAETLKNHAATGVPSARQLRARQLEEIPATPLPGWAESVNTRLTGLVRIKPAKPALSADQEQALLEAQSAREEVLDALALIQAESR